MPELRSGSRARHDLAEHLTEFIAALAKAGYSEKTQHDKERLIVPFIEWVRKSRIGIRQVNQACVGAFLACPSRRRYNHSTALCQFVESLRTVQAVPLPHSKASAAESVVCRYVGHLRDKQGLSPHTIAVRRPFVRAFVVAQRLP